MLRNAATRQSSGRRKLEPPWPPFIVANFHQMKSALLAERLGELPEWPFPCLATIDVLHRCKRIVIRTEPNVEPVFLNALIRSFVASAGAFSSKPPTLLIYGDVVLRSAISARLLGKLVCRRQCGHSTAENGDFFRTLARS